MSNDADSPHRGPAAGTPIDCARHGAAIEDLLSAARADGDGHDAYAAHRATCPACTGAFDAARRLEAAIPRWIAPDPPPGFAARVLRALADEISSRACAEFLSRLDAWRAGDLDDPAAADCARHARDCDSCAAETALAEKIDLAIRRVRAPGPAPTFAERVLLELAAAPPHVVRAAVTRAGDFVAPAPPHRVAAPRSRVRSGVVVAGAALAAAAALLLLAAPRETSLGSPRDVPPVASGPSPGPTPRTDLTRFVVDEVRPGSIGSFAGSPRRVDHFARSGGNLFHRTLREAKLDRIAAEPLPARAGDRGR